MLLLKEVYYYKRVSAKNLKVVENWFFITYIANIVEIRQKPFISIWLSKKLSYLKVNDINIMTQQIVNKTSYALFHLIHIN